MEFELDRDGKFGKEGLAFDDVLLVPAESAVLPHEVSTVTRLTRTITLEIPIVSAAMDTVTEARLAIALAREGGIGVLHCNLSIDDQVAALPLGARLVLDPWSSRLELIRAAAQLPGTVREKVPLLVSPLFPYLKYSDTPPPPEAIAANEKGRKSEPDRIWTCTLWKCTAVSKDR